ncbi:UbiA family prenyltransferase [Halocynthiibacter sp. C4]|uniref:UbiA family prenyltransferase n=1 Tax=Halocynthiibacter sp. C4 TaxID=2992758 RepID=UPI00237C060C|nr:UbiA family prenyltransferase [Halocynthiibacter sp. C4]MDE0588713.1 UbiA family prenyltransferase [Halocynthiibacter sp. C4]
MANEKPLVLDVDGTFLKTDMLFECFWAGLGKAPFQTLQACLQNFGDRARLKQELAQIAGLRTELLPVNAEVNDLAKVAASHGCDIILASASDEQLVRKLAEEHEFSAEVIASDGVTNMKGAAKADALVTRYGEKGFHYAGNEAADIPIWEKADGAIVVGQPKIAETLQQAGHNVTEVENSVSLKDIYRTMRPHQWVKNILMVLPLIAAHQFDLQSWLLVLLGMVAFSAAASSIYLVNDLLDLEADRLHVKKCKRPFAAGLVPIKYGMLGFVVLAGIALGVGAALGPAFLGVILLYVALSLAYSMRLKRMRWIDIAVLATLYTLRVVAGAAATGVEASGYMLLFILPIFLTLGCVKRLTELTLATGDERLPGRGYGRKDRSDLINVGSLGIVGALLLFFFYSISDHALSLYPIQWLLWLALVPIAIWLIRMLVLGYQGKQDYDPIVFALTDKIGLGILFFTLSLMFYAAGLWQRWFQVWAG